MSPVKIFFDTACSRLLSDRRITLQIFMDREIRFNKIIEKLGEGGNLSRRQRSI
jgi:hypothetical protein